MVDLAKLDERDRWTLPVMRRYVRRLLADSERQYREWLERNAPDPIIPPSEKGR